MKTALITGSSGLIGSEATLFFGKHGWDVHGVDNNLRMEFFGPDGDTTGNLLRLKREVRNFTHHDMDIRHRGAILELFRVCAPDLIIHCAAQPSHDLARYRTFDDFDVNAVGTLNLLEAARQRCPESPFVFMSTNKVYGSAPNERRLVELPTRWDYVDSKDRDGVDESCRIDTSFHSLFGASKLAADLMVQEYGHSFNLPTVCFRAGCVTGPNHAGTELHGFLSYLARAVAEGRGYRIYGYKGKQVRDNIHSYDVCTAILAFYERPKTGAVYNLGGGRANSISVLEAIARLQELTGRVLGAEYVDRPRVGDHICYITDLRRLKSDFPGWEITRTLEDILPELVGRWRAVSK